MYRNDKKIVLSSFMCRPFVRRALNGIHRMVIVMEECGEQMVLNDKEMIKREITKGLSIHLDTCWSPFPFLTITFQHAVQMMRR